MIRISRLPPLFTYICSLLTVYWGPGNHSKSTPGGRPMFLKPNLHKEFNNGFKTINYRPNPVLFFSRNYFRLFSHVKKLNSFQHFGNISTDSESPAVKLVLLMHLYWHQNSKINKTSNFFDDFFGPKIVFWKIVVCTG